MKKIILSLGFLLWLVGCMPSPAQQPTRTTTEITPSQQSLETFFPLPASTKTPLPTTAHVQASPPTRTPLPSTPHVQASPPTRTPSPSPTADLAAIVIVDQQPSRYASYPSSDGKWRVDIDIFDCVRVNESGDEYAYEELVLVDLTSGEKQVVDEQLQSCGGMGAFGFEGRYWSPDNNYFYYTTARQGVPDGCGYWVPPLSRFNIDAPHSEYLGMGTRSPDGGKLATWALRDKELVIRDIDAGEISRRPAFSSRAESGPISWSPDSQSVVYLQVNSWCPLSGKSYLVEFNLLNSGETLLLESENPTFASVEWTASDDLILLDEDGKEWKYSPLTHELTQVP